LGNHTILSSLGCLIHSILEGADWWSGYVAYHADHVICSWSIKRMLPNRLPLPAFFVLLSLYTHTKKHSTSRPPFHPVQASLSQDYILVGITKHRPRSTLVHTTQHNKTASTTMTTKNDIRGKPLTGFLSLAPATSDTYPKQQTGSSIPTSPSTSEAPSTASSRRTSSQSSAGGLRFLKLGPVHHGEHLGEHKEDYYEVAVE
jgi:hypothetical protein